MMTVKALRDWLANLPDDMQVYAETDCLIAAYYDGDVELSDEIELDLPGPEPTEEQLHARRAAHYRREIERHQTTLDKIVGMSDAEFHAVHPKVLITRHRAIQLTTDALIALHEEVRQHGQP